MRMRIGVALVAAVALASGCSRELSDGQYRLTQTGPATLDTCGLFPEGGSLPDARLTRMGDEVHLDMELFGPDAPVQMVGLFKLPVTGQRDVFAVDGSMGNVTVRVNGVDCVVRFGQVHVEAEVSRADDAFWGTLGIGEDFEANQDPRCPVRCDASVPYSAAHGGD